MATREYMESQTYSATIGGVVYNVTASLGGSGGSVVPVGTAAADDVTPTVLGLGVLVLDDNTGATAITQLDDGSAGQKITLLCIATSNEPTITDGGNFALTGDWTPNAGDTLGLVTADGSTWYETARSAN